MEQIRLSDLDLLEVGNTIQIVGGLWQGNGKTFLTVLPDEDVAGTDVVLLKMNLAEWEMFLRQTDLSETRILEHDGAGIKKAIVRKTQRQIDGNLQWVCWKRDEFKCRYCSRDDVQLTIDHCDLWEELGVSTEENLISCCKRCNRTRGSIPYEAWIASSTYKRISGNVAEKFKKENEDMVGRLPHLRTLRTFNRRSR